MSKNANLVFSYINDKADINATNNTKSIRMSSEGFCIAITSPQDRLEKLFHYSYVSGLSWKEKLEIITDFDKEESRYSRNIFRIYTEYNTQIPEEFYSYDDEPKIAALLTDNPENFIPISEKIGSWKLYTISLWDKRLETDIKEKFFDFQLSTIMASLMNSISKQEQETAFIFIENNNFTIVAGNKENLLGANTFSFTSETDFLYYCLAFLRKIFQKTNNIPLILCGNIIDQSPLFTALKKYFSSVKLITPEDGNNFPIDNYSYYCDLF
jgi:hypothetical protein